MLRTFAVHTISRQGSVWPSQGRAATTTTSTRRRRAINVIDSSLPRRTVRSSTVRSSQTNALELDATTNNDTTKSVPYSHLSSKGKEKIWIVTANTYKSNTNARTSTGTGTGTGMNHNKNRIDLVSTSSSQDGYHPSAPTNNQDTNEPLPSKETIQNLQDTINLKEIFALAQQPCTPLSLSNMYKYANANSSNYKSQRLRNAQFLHRELPIRIAQRAVDLMTLPHGLNHTLQVRTIVSIYLDYLRQFRSFPLPNNETEELAFSDMLRPMVLDRSSIPIAISQGLKSLTSVTATGTSSAIRTHGSKERNIPHEKNEMSQQDLPNPNDSTPHSLSYSDQDNLRIHQLQEMEDALNRFFTARIGLRLLTEHHILSCVARKKENEELRLRQSYFENVPLQDDGNDDALRHSETEKKDDVFFWGCIKANCNPAFEARRVAEQVVQHCQECYGMAPDIQIMDCTPERFVEFKFTYVPHHLHYMLAELLKNSCRATIRRHLAGKVVQEDHLRLHHSYEGQDGSPKGIVTETALHPIRVVIVKGLEDVTIKIADQGGGVARSVLDKMWTFAHSTLKDDHMELNTNFERDDFTGGKIRGFGLPLARIYARYFGGDLTLKSMEGYGVDAYLYLPVLGAGCENLPQRVLSSPSVYDCFTCNDGMFRGETVDSSKSTISF